MSSIYLDDEAIEITLKLANQYMSGTEGTYANY